MYVDMEIPAQTISNVLDAILWTINPYLDYGPGSTIHDYPWIIELINSYNDLVSLIPHDERYEYKIIEL